MNGSMSRLAQEWCAQVLAMAHAHGKQTRVVVTGQGIVSSLGQTVDEFYNNLLKVRDSGATMVDLFSILPVINSPCSAFHMWMQGKSGISPIERFDTSEYATRFAGEVKELATDGFVSKKNVRRLDDTIKYILVSGKQVGWSVAPLICSSNLELWGPHGLHSVAAVQSSHQGHGVLHEKGVFQE